MVARRLAPVLACLVAVALPAPAAAADGDVSAAVTRWSTRIAEPARELRIRLAAAAKPQQTLVFLRSFTTVARNGQTAIGATRPSTSAGARVRILAGDAFAKYGAAGALLIQAVRDQRAGKARSVIERKVDGAAVLARAGSLQLGRVSKLLPRLAGG